MSDEHPSTTPAMTPEEKRYAQARERMLALKGLYGHALVYLVVNGALFAINVLVGGPYWFLWPLIGWGVGLAVHALGVLVFSGGGPLGTQWEERKIQQLVNKERWS